MEGSSRQDNRPGVNTGRKKWSRVGKKYFDGLLRRDPPISSPNPFDLVWTNVNAGSAARVLPAAITEIEREEAGATIMNQVLGPEPGPEVFLILGRDITGYPVAWRLTGLTKAELDALKEVIVAAFIAAEDTVRERDERATDEDYIQPRKYRSLPIITRNARLRGGDHRSIHE